MRIIVTAEEGLSGQTRAYAEYRVFSSLARFGADVCETTVSLEPPRDGAAAACRVAVSLCSGVRVRIRARGRHPHDAIDKAAGRAGDMVRRRVRAAAVAP